MITTRRRPGAIASRSAIESSIVRSRCTPARSAPGARNRRGEAPGREQEPVVARACSPSSSATVCAAGSRRRRPAPAAAARPDARRTRPRGARRSTIARPRRRGTPSRAAGGCTAARPRRRRSRCGPSYAALPCPLGGACAGEAAADDDESGCTVHLNASVPRSPQRARNSLRVRPSSRTTPMSDVVTVRVPSTCTPRSDMQRCSASSTTPAPRGSSVSPSQVDDLSGHPLLHLQVAREQVDDPGELREADETIARNVADVRHAAERQEVMLAERVERDVGHDDEFAVVARRSGTWSATNGAE